MLILKPNDLEKIFTPLFKKIIRQEFESELKAKKISKEIEEHREYMKERRKHFDLIRNK